ncbi:hypothetical protein GCM10020256_02730 [Streptomyces thermocoprophilus]
MTNPDRSTSKGRDAVSGSEDCGDRGFHLGERGEGEGVQGRLDTAGDDDVGAPGADEVLAEGEGLRAGRAGADRGAGASLGAEVHADPGGGPVGHEHGDGER